MHSTHTQSGFAAVVLDPHPLYQEGLASLFARTGVRLLGATSSTDCALELIEVHRPDVLVMDIEATAGSLDPFTYLRVVRERYPEVAPVVLTGHRDRPSVRAARTAGAVAYLLKSAGGDEIAALLDEVFRGAHAADGHNGLAPVTSPLWPMLVQPYMTQRELEILGLVAEGRSNRQVAELLWISDQTVKFHLRNVYRKLKVNSRQEAASWARAHGLVAGNGSTNGSAVLAPGVLQTS